MYRKAVIEGSGKRRIVALSLIGCFLLLFSLRGAAANDGQSAPKAADSEPKSILDMDIEQLAKVDIRAPALNVEVTSVSKQPSTVGRSPAAIFVITNEMIRRSGATSIPEALRLAPGLEVARVNSNTWAITSRGFNGVYANKLLVLIDGRTVYSPVFSGVYWDVQDVLLEDVERIEVIRGPGGTLWGANAVNGVINIITKKAADTQGAYVSVGGGTEERFLSSARYGGQLGEDCYYRLYGKYFDRAPFFDPTGPSYDAWNQGRFGFRADWNLDEINSLTIQGDHYVGNSGITAGFTSFQPPYYKIKSGLAHNTGQNVLLRWRHVYDEDSDWALQTYYDQFDRGTILNSEKVKTFDIDFQYRFPLAERHRIICGVGYRHIHDFLPSEDLFTLGNIPVERTTFVASQFLQDEIVLREDELSLTLGCKLEQNSYTYFEYQPTARLLWTPDEKHSIWGAVSRAVHTPSRVDENLFATTAYYLPPFPPIYFRTTGNPDIQSETLLAYELGYRTQATERFSYDVAAFYNVYDNLRAFGIKEFEFPFLYFTIVDGPPADTYGVELATDWAVTERWHLYTQYTFLRIFIHGDSLYGDGCSPRHQVYLRSAWNLRENLDFDLMFRYVDALHYLDVPSYMSLDLRLAWRPRANLELALVGQNLLQDYHYEYGYEYDSQLQVTQIPRGVYGTITWRY